MKGTIGNSGYGEVEDRYGLEGNVGICLMYFENIDWGDGWFDFGLKGYSGIRFKGSGSGFCWALWIDWIKWNGPMTCFYLLDQDVLVVVV